MSKKKAKVERPAYVIKVHRDWKYGPRARFWEIQTWHERPQHEDGGYWSSACKGGSSIHRMFGNVALSISV
jgi:hypothetical protein